MTDLRDDGPCAAVLERRASLQFLGEHPARGQVPPWAACFKQMIDVAVTCCPGRVPLLAGTSTNRPGALAQTRWAMRRRPWQGSAARISTVGGQFPRCRAVIRADLLREGPEALYVQQMTTTFGQSAAGKNVVWSGVVLRKVAPMCFFGSEHTMRRGFALPRLRSMQGALRLSKRCARAISISVPEAGRS